jgi:hypothetical protein
MTSRKRQNINKMTALVHPNLHRQHPSLANVVEAAGQDPTQRLEQPLSWLVSLLAVWLVGPQSSATMVIMIRCPSPALQQDRNWRTETTLRSIPIPIPTTKSSPRIPTTLVHLQARLRKPLQLPPVQYAMAKTESFTGRNLKSID